MKLAICADLHVDDFGSKVDRASGLNARFVEALDATRFVATTARELGADALIVAGDYTEQRTPAPPRVARIIDALRSGPARQVHVRGNHDQERAGQSIVNVLGQVDGWTGFTGPGIDYLAGGVAVCVIPFLSPSYLRSQPGMEGVTQSDIYRALADMYLTIARGLFVQAQEAWPDAMPILIGHQQLSGGRMNESQQAFLGDLDLVVDARALASIGYAAVVYGHVHKAQVVVDDPACPVLFTGSTHRVDFAEELDEQSFVILDIVPGQPVSVERIPIPSRRFVTLTAPRPEDAFNVAGAVVRCVDVPVDVDVAELRRILEEREGAFEITEIRTRRPDHAAAVGGMAEGLTAQEALLEFFAGDPDHDAIVELGRALLEEVAA